VLRSNCSDTNDARVEGNFTRWIDSVPPNQAFTRIVHHKKITPITIYELTSAFHNQWNESLELELAAQLLGVLKQCLKTLSRVIGLFMVRNRMLNQFGRFERGNDDRSKFDKDLLINVREK
jgi:hypothetical protein